MPLFVRVITEGPGDKDSVVCLFRRIWKEIHQVDWDFISVTAVRNHQGTLLQEEGLRKAVEGAKLDLNSLARRGGEKLIVILMDAEKNCPKELAPRLLQWAKQERTDADIACVLANPMFETWFIAAAASLAGFNGLPADLATPGDPEGKRLGKPWLRSKLRPARAYKETADQRLFTEKMNLAECRQNSPSFEKLCRELEKRLPARPAPPQ